MRAVLINTTDEIGHHGCTLVNRQIDHYARLVGIDFVERLSLNQNWNTVRDFDIALVNGEGSLHGSSKAPNASRKCLIGLILARKKLSS